MKDSSYVKTETVNPLYLIISEVDGHIQEKNWKKYSICNSEEGEYGIIRSVFEEDGKFYPQIYRQAFV